MDPPTPTSIDTRFRVWLEREDEACVVVVTGETDLAVAERLTQALDAALLGAETVLVDLCACSFIDSVGLSAVLQASQQARRDGKRLGVATVPGSPARALFDLVFGRGLFASSDDRATGLAALRVAP